MEFYFVTGLTRWRMAVQIKYMDAAPKKSGEIPSRELSTRFSIMSRLTREGTAEPVSRDQVLRRVRGQGNIHFNCSADHEQDRQPYSVDPYSAICDDHTFIHTYFLTLSDTEKAESRGCAPLR